MKRTPDDDVFVAEFAKALRREYERAKIAGISDQVFAHSIGVQRAQLDRYLDGRAMPSVRTVAFAFREHRIAIAYCGIPLRTALPKREVRKKRTSINQMTLPFFIETEKSASRIGLKLNAVSARRFAILMTVDQAG
jgi:hypothetical protein